MPESLFSVQCDGNKPVAGRDEAYEIFSILSVDGGCAHAGYEERYLLMFNYPLQNCCSLITDNPDWMLYVFSANSVANECLFLGNVVNYNSSE